MNPKLIILTIDAEFGDETQILLPIEDACKLVKALKLELAE